MTLEDALAAMRTMGEANARFTDDLIDRAFTASKPGLVWLRPGELTAREKYDALTNPRTAADYGVSMSADEYQAEAKRRGQALPDWWPRTPTT